MNILYMTLSFNLNESDLYQNLVIEMLNRGHNIIIVRAAKKTNILKVNENLIFIDVKTGDPFKKNKFIKGFNQILLNFNFKNAIKRYLRYKNIDVILYATPPITLYSTIKYCKKKYKAKTFLMLKDIFPQNAVDLGFIKKNGIIYKYFRWLEKRYYKISDFIGCMSEGNIKFLKEHNSEIESRKIGLFPNSIYTDNGNHTIFNKDKTVFIFGGNLGKPQNVEILLKVIERLRSYAKAEFIIIGQGTEKERIKDFYNEKKLPNFKFMDFLPQNEYEQLLQTADIGLISLSPNFTIPNIPSRFQTYLKLRKPILAITDIYTDLKNMILDNDCGWWCDARDENKIVEIVKEICENKEKQKQKGLNGYAYLCKDFDVRDNATIIEQFGKEIK